MNTVKVNKNGCKMIAHRGLSGIERENTNAAFVAAGNRSYYGIETDVHVTKDGKYVIFHDDSTGRLADADVLVEGTDFDKLRSYTLLDMDGTRSRKDLCMPSLEEYISICKKYDKCAVLELKNAFAKKQIYEICSIIAAMDYLENVVFISFCYDNLVAIKEKYPQQTAQLLISYFHDNLIDMLQEYNLDLDIYHEALNEDIVHEVKKAGIKINCWTVDDKERCEKLIEWGVDYVTTNILE
ncbi:MAG: hypothetical protein E7388_06235 [Ruminococcaceae bacterium]|nr:hypothetical protein [Oscillospiraceae bacterium]